MLKVKNLKASVKDSSSNNTLAKKQEILKGIDLEVKSAQFHVLMGPNGSGKSTLAKVVAGHPSFVVDGGKMSFGGKDLKKLTPGKRAKFGIFLGFQHPVEIPGVSVMNVLRKSKRLSQGISLSKFREELLEKASSLKLSKDFLRRAVNEGFSGGEKKRNEILQMMALKPKLAILDEIDSGLDVDGLKIVASSIKKFKRENPKSSIILITHYARILNYLKPDFVHVMVEGKIVKSGKAKLANEIEDKGYKFVNKKVENIIG